MTIRNLEHGIHPRSVAVIGASDRHGSVGKVVLANIINGGFAGAIWPVNPKHDQVAQLKCYASVTELPGVPDLAIILTPAGAVPDIIHELGENGCRVAVVITAGLTGTNGLKQAMLDAAKPYLFRIIGPNTLGIILPLAKLNASFGHLMPKAGNIALLSQSGAIVTSLIDWAADKAIGFSHIVSLGDMADVDVGDYLDMLAGDAHTKAIVMYLESIPDARKFMSAARACARLKPVITIKAGRHIEAAKAALTHTGALSGADRVTDAALRRAGILRVFDLEELFGATETIGRFGSLAKARAGIVTNGGGAGVLAVDHLIDRDCELAELSVETIQRLDKTMPANWSKTNPVDIIGDAPAERYLSAIAAVAADPGTDVVVVMNCPTALASAVDAARAVASLATDGLIGGKPLLTCWLGALTARHGREVLEQAGVASYESPLDVAVAVSDLVKWSRAQTQLTRVPSSLGEDKTNGKALALAIFCQAAKEGRRLLTEPEAKSAIAAYGIEVPQTMVAASLAEVEPLAAKLLENCASIAVKLYSKTLTHKSDLGGVVLNIETAKAAFLAATNIENRVKAKGLQQAVDGFSLQPMIIRSQALELILGVSRDPVFGPVILFGAGGVGVEVMDDTAIGLPPLDNVLAGDLIDATRIGRLLAGFRDRKPADRAAIIKALNALSQMIVDFPAIIAIDINPLLADSDCVIALDARIEFEPGDVERPAPNPDLAIRPYPAGWGSVIIVAGRSYELRPIKPSDVSLYPDFLAKLSPDDVRLRFLAPRKEFSDQMLIRLTQLDYDREMAFVLIDQSTSELAGVARISGDPNHEIAQYGIVVRTDLQGQGLGWALMKQLIDYARKDGFVRLEGFLLAENAKMIEMCRDFGFHIGDLAERPGVLAAELQLTGGSLRDGQHPLILG